MARGKASRKGSGRAFSLAKNALAQAAGPLAVGAIVRVNPGTGFEFPAIIVAIVTSRFGFAYKVQRTAGDYAGCTFHVSAGSVNEEEN